MKKLITIFLLLIFISCSNTPEPETKTPEIVDVAIRSQNNGKMAYKVALRQYVVNNHTMILLFIDFNVIDSMYEENRAKFETIK